MGKVKGIDDFRREIYNGLVSKGYSKSYENFVQKNGLEAKAEDVWNTSVSNGLYDGDLDQFKSDFYGVKKKEASVPSAKSVEQSEKSYVNIAGVTESGSALEKTTIRPMAENIGFGAYATGRDLAQENRVKQIKEMRAERPGATIVEVKGDDGRLTMKFLEDHKQAVKNKAGRLPDAATIEAQPLEQSVEQYYQNKPDYLQMIAEREKKGYGNTYNQGKLVDQGITEMQRDVRNAIDVKAKEIGAATLNQYLNLNEQLKKTPENSPDYPKLVQDYQLFNEAHPDLAEYEGLVDRFWALNKKQQEAKKNPAYKDYYALQAKREQAQANADLFERTGIDPGTSGGIRNPFLPAATKEVFDLGTGVVRAAAGMQRWLTGQKYVGLDQVVENMERVLDPQNYASTATPSNRTQLVGQRYADVGNFRVLMDGDKIASVVTKDGGYRVRDQKKVDEVVQAFERDKPQIKTQALNPYTATDVIIGGATQLGLGLTGAGIGAKLGKAGSALANFGSKATSVATNAAGTYNKLYNSAIQELGAANQKAAERYAGIASMGMSLIGTLINPLEQQLLGQVQKNSIRLLAKELSEGVAEQTAVRNASRMLLNGLKTLGKEGALEGGVEALLDDAVKFGVNKTMLKNEPGFEIDLPQDILDNVAEETLGGLFGSVSASISPSTMQQESLVNAYKSPNRAKILAKLDKNAAKHYEKVFAKADVTGRSVVDIHKEELVKAKTGEDYVAPSKEVSEQEGQAVSQPVESTPEPAQESLATTVKEIADGIDLQVGQKVTTPMGQTGTVIGFDSDQDNDEEGEGTANNYVVRMDESGEETVISIADYNKKVYEQGISKLQAQGMDRNEAEFAIEAARSLRAVGKGQPEVVNESSVAPDAVQVEPNVDLTAPQVEGAAISDPVEQQQVGSIEDAQIETDTVVQDTVQSTSIEDTITIDSPQSEPDVVQSNKEGQPTADPTSQIEPTSEVQTTPDAVAQVEPTPTPQVQEQQASSEDIALAQKLLGEARAGLRQNLQAVADKAISALKKYGNLSVVFHDTNEAATEAYQKVGGKMKSVTGFYDPKTKTIHVSLESKNPTHTILHEALHLFIKNLDTAAFNKLFEELTSIPEYTQVLKSKGRSVKQHAALYPERSQKEEALVEYFAAIASGEIPVKRDSKVIQILNKLLKLMGFEGVVDNSNIRFFAEGIATALREGIEIEKFGSSEPSAEVEAEVIIDFPYYDQVAKLTEIGLQRGLSESQITSNITNALTAQGINADPAVVTAIYKARSATFKRKGKINNKALAKIKELHQKLFVSTGGGAIREMAERLDGTVMRYVDQVNALIRKAEKQSKNVDQDLVDRFLRDENSADEKQVIVDELRKAGFPESNLEQYQRRGTTRYQRAEMVSEFRRKTDDKINELTQKKGAILAVDLNTLYSTSFTIDDATRKQIAEQLRNAGLVAFANRYESGNTTSAERKLTIDGAIAEIDSQIKGSQSNLSSLTDSLAQQFIDSQMNDTDRAKVPDDLAETLTTMRQQIDNLSQYLIDEGYVVGDRQEVITKNLGQYLSDVYGIFKDEKFKPTKAAEEKAKKYFIQQIKNDPQKLAALSATGNDLDQEIEKEATRMVNDYKAKSKTKQGTSTGGAIGKKSEAIFKKKEGVPDELKDLLGKYTPLQEFAYTMYQLVSYVEKSKFQRRMVNLGKGTFMWDKNDPARPEDANYELKGFASAKLSGDTNPFKGMMVTKEVYDVLNGLDQMMFDLGGLMKPYLKFQGFVNKMKTVYSYQTHIGNVLGNLFFMAFNGMLDVSTLKSITTASKAATRDLFNKYGSSNDEVEEALTILKNEGVIGNEISIQAIRAAVQNVGKTDSERLLSRSNNPLAKFDRGLTNLYQSEDSFFKVLAYLTERNRYSKALYGQDFKNLSKVEQEEVNRQATEIAKSNWPNYGRMGKLAQLVAKNNPLFGNFLSFTFEAVRTYGNTIGLAKRELQSPNPKVKLIGAKRAVGIIGGSIAADVALKGLASVAGGIFGLFFKGEDDSKLNRDLRIGVPDFIKGGDLLFTKVKPGVYQVVDISAKNPLSLFRKMFNSAFYTPSDTEIAQAIGTQLFEAFLDDSIARKFIQGLTTNDDMRGRHEPIWSKSDTEAEAAEKIMMFTMRNIGPGSVSGAQKLINAGEDWKNTALNQARGLNTYTIEYERVWRYEIMEYGNQSQIRSDIYKPLKEVATDPDATDREFKDALAEYNRKRKIQMDKLMDVKQSMLNVMPGDEGAKIVKEVIEDASLSGNEKRYLITGDWKDYKKSRNEFKYKE